MILPKEDLVAHPWKKKRLIQVKEHASYIGVPIREHTDICKLEDALLFHPQQYIERIRAEQTAKAIIRDNLHVLSAALRAMETAISHKKAVLVAGGGHHHVMKGHGNIGGWDYISDIGVLIEKARMLGYSPILVIDLDAHHGNGIENAYYGDKNVIYASVHTWNIFPYTGWWSDVGADGGIGTTINIPLPKKIGDKTLTYVVRDLLSIIKEHFNPKFIIYIAGSDMHWQDPLGKQRVTLNGLYERDRLVMSAFKNVPVVILAGGGYGPASGKALLNLWAAITRRGQYFYENKVPTNEHTARIQRIKRNLQRLKAILHEVL